MTRGVDSCVTQTSEFGGEDVTGGRGVLTRVRTCPGRPGRVSTGAGRAWPAWEVTRRGPSLGGAALCRGWTAGEAPGLFHRGTPGADV